MTVSRLQWGVLASSVVFATLWWILANEQRVPGAVFVLAVGFLQSTFSVRTLALLQRAPTTRPVDASRSDSRTPAPKEASVQPPDLEPPEHQRARFLGALGHELRNPLNSVTGFSDMLLGRVDGDLNAEQERSVRTIRASAERLLRLIATLVDHAKLEAGTLRLQQQWVSPSELVDEAIAFARSRAEGMSVVGGVADGLPPVFVDRHHIVQALASLSVLMLRSSETDVSLRVAPPRRDQSGRGFVQFDVMASLADATNDTLAVVEKLETPLSRSDALGLEVAVARSVIEAHGGRIWTEAGTAGSLRVCVTLPTSAV